MLALQDILSYNILEQAQNNTLINQVSIEPGNSVEATTQVTDVSRPIAVAIHIERPEGVVRVIETVKDPSEQL